MTGSVEVNNTDSDDPVAWKTSGNEFFSKGQYENALRCYAHAIERDPGYIDAWNNMGYTLMKMGRIDEAKQCNAKIKEITKKIALESEKEPLILPTGQPSPETKSLSYDSSQEKGEKNPLIAALLSLVLVGLGQIYNGSTRRALLFLAGTIIGLFIFVIPGVIVYLFCIYDAYTTARKMNTGALPFRETNTTHLILYIGVILAVFLAVVIAAFIFGMQGSS